jgi:putative ABC transport system permease protein
MPGESRSGTLSVRLRGPTADGYVATLRRIATSVDANLQLTKVSTLDAKYREYTRFTAVLALVIALITGSVLLLSAAGIHALMSFTVNQRRREIGIRAALGAPAGQIVGSILSRATRQLGFGVAVGLAVAVGLNRLSGGAFMRDTALLLVPLTAAFMLAVGVLAAAGPARRSFRVQPTEALRAD